MKGISISACAASVPALIAAAPTMAQQA